MIVIFFLIFCFSIEKSSSTVTIPNVTPSTCSSTEYFQFSSVRCEKCGPNQVRSNDMVSCACMPDSKLLTYFGGPVKVCQKCQPPKVVSHDGWACIDCPVGKAYNSNTKKCVACTATLQTDVDTSEKGALLARKQCLTCEGATEPSSSHRICRRCHSQVLKVTSSTSCVCPTGAVLTGGVCLSSSSAIPIDDPTSYMLRFRSNFLSSYFKEHFRAAKVLCQDNQNFTACQQLGNLCVMLRYNEDNVGRVATDACKEYLTLVRSYSGGFVAGITDWPETMPWLYYKAESTAALLTKTNIQQSFSRGEVIKYSFANYAVNGSFLGISTDAATVLQLCPKEDLITEKAFQITTQYQVACQMSVSKLLQKETVFYDIFLQLGENEESLYPIPVLVDNINVRGSLVNQDSDQAKWKLNRRFFLMDKYSGLRSLDQGALPDFVQFASLIELEYSLREDGLFYPPLLKVRYDVVPVSSNTMTTTKVNLEFKVLYKMDTSKLEENIKITVGVLSALGVAYALVKIVSWRRREGLQMLDCSSCMLFIVYVCSALTLVFVAVLFVACIQWQFFFKRQETIIRVLPTSEQESLIQGLLVAAFVMKAVDILYILYSQVYVDIFFIDWERPRGSVSVGRGGNGRQPGSGGVREGVSSPVSVMRTLFVANEWREIQTIRRIKPTFQVLVVVLFLQGFGFQYWTTSDPVNRLTVDYTTDYVGNPNLCLRIAIVCLLYLAVAVAQWIVFGFVYERFVADGIGDFIDFCSMSNISVFVMSQKQFGYYIHGRSVHGRSDTSLHELYEQFQREEDNLCGKRGLEPNSDRQTFEMALSIRFRNEYSKILQPLLTRDVQGARRGQQNMTRQNPSLPGSNLSPALERSVKAYNQMNRYLSSFMEHAIRDNDYSTRDKLFMEKLLRNELQPPLDKSIFYNDDGRSFTSILLYGQEWSLLLFNLLLFLVVDWASGWNVVVAGFVAYLVDIVLVNVRDSLGRKNLASKTMVDERFLI